MQSKSRSERRPVRYAVVGVGHIAQVAVLPGFANAENSELTALVSDDATKLRELGRQYDVAHGVSYDEYDELLSSGKVDAVYIALPNHLHREYAVRAAELGVHALCEKPLAVTERDCMKMIAAAEESGVTLMTAYRLHFERANLEAIEIVQGDELGRIRSFHSIFTQNVKPGDIRLSPVEQGGGALYDLGIYCVNAARYLFRAEPICVHAVSISGVDERFAHCDATTSAILRFPDDRIATFTCGFDGADVSMYRVVGSDGELVMEPAYEYATELGYRVRASGHRTERRFEKRDQFGPELFYFSECILEGRQPEPDGHEGLADVRVIESIHESARTGRVVNVPPTQRSRRPGIEQRIERPGFDEPPKVHASGPRQ
jgi:glucose-fructose oxidoreductase